MIHTRLYEEDYHYDYNDIRDYDEAEELQAIEEASHIIDEIMQYGYIDELLHYYDALAFYARNYWSDKTSEEKRNVIDAFEEFYFLRNKENKKEIKGDNSKLRDFSFCLNLLKKEIEKLS